MTAGTEPPQPAGDEVERELQLTAARLHGDREGPRRRVDREVRGPDPQRGGVGRRRAHEHAPGARAHALWPREQPELRALRRHGHGDRGTRRPAVRVSGGECEPLLPRRQPRGWQLLAVAEHARAGAPRQRCAAKLVAGVVECLAGETDERSGENLRAVIRRRDLHLRRRAERAETCRRGEALMEAVLGAHADPCVARRSEIRRGDGDPAAARPDLDHMPRVPAVGRILDDRHQVIAVGVAGGPADRYRPAPTDAGTCAWRKDLHDRRVRARDALGDNLARALDEIDRGGSGRGNASGEVERRRAAAVDERRHHPGGREHVPRASRVTRVKSLDGSTGVGAPASGATSVIDGGVPINGTIA